ncbi:hypothetical protein JHK87_001526 [Glycine soja]|nr:hypothetical protein JHK87_001526 [Glycine soja]
MGEVNKVLEQNIEFLKDVTCSNHALKGELVEANKANKKLLDRILNLEADYDKDKSDIIRALELDLSKEREALTLQVSENQELRTHIKGALTRRKLANNGLTKRMEITESLEDEILKMNSVFSQMNDAFKNLSSDLDDVTNERDQLQGQVICLKNRLEKAEANEAIAQEAQKNCRGTTSKGFTNLVHDLSLERTKWFPAGLLNTIPEESGFQA